MESEEIREHLRPIQTAYNAAVREIVEEAIREYPANEDERGEFIDQSIDGSEWVIYTWKAQLVIVLSGNADAYIEYGLNETRAVIDWSALAYAAMQQDANDLLAVLAGTTKG
jgi:hypothetical protein